MNIPPARRRQLRTWTPSGKDGRLQAGMATADEGLLDLASNDYLSLCRHPAVIAAAHEELLRSGAGAAGSRLVSGTRPVHDQLETALSHWLERERVLLFPSGFQANLAAVTALAGRHTIVLADRLIHHSLLVGVQASGARLRRFAHNDLQALEHLLLQCRDDRPGAPLLVITESLFSMEGTSPALTELSALCRQHGAQLLLDEAHALGVLGDGGRGLGYRMSDVTMISGTFGKSFGSGGAFLACDEALGDHLLQSSGAFRYTTALAPSLAAAALAALQLIQDNPSWGAELLQRGEIWRARLQTAGWTRPMGTGPILPLVVGDDQTSLDLQGELEQAGLLTVAIRPPTVPEGCARLRLVLHRTLPDETLDSLIQVLARTGSAQ
ncbi:MAG: 8-amino-7-oxononanoate synthase [Synechococcus sp. EAC657]|nr:8-amino-7-oxononanoate synthase [Synechococcus sp. EAC657]MEC7247924.1 8-amino-7-oxononanoate synthase [Cyanobacteriota bacterium]MEC7898183.1 8-amino-7-oxononanoate synthase [Cyanobacteriota bacterium]